MGGKSVKIYLTLKKTCLGCFRYKGERGDDKETGLKEGRVIEIETTVLHSQCTLLRLIYLPIIVGTFTFVSCNANLSGCNDF